MKMNDMVIISVDDHISEPPDMFKRHLSGDALAIGTWMNGVVPIRAASFRARCCRPGT
jgi:hypothetical protein